jgi:hypothetical protein
MKGLSMVQQMEVRWTRPFLNLIGILSCCGIIFTLVTTLKLDPFR